MVGPIIDHKRLISPSPHTHMNKWISGSQSGSSIIINFSELSYLSNKKMKTIFDLALELQKLKMRVLWLLTAEQYDDLHIITQVIPSNLRIKKLESLRVEEAYANTGVKLIVSQCSLVSAQDALYFGKPLLCIPLLADEHDITARVLDFKYGLSLSQDNFNVESLMQSIEPLIKNDSPERIEIMGHVQKIHRLLRNSDGLTKALEVIQMTMEIGIRARQREIIDGRGIVKSNYTAVMLLALMLFFIAVRLLFLWLRYVYLYMNKKEYEF
eukprot:g1681.t1